MEREGVRVSSGGLTGNRVSTILADVDHFPGPDGGHSIDDLVADRGVMAETVSGDMDDHDSKSEQGKVVLCSNPWSIVKKTSHCPRKRSMRMLSGRPPHPKPRTERTE